MNQVVGDCTSVNQFFGLDGSLKNTMVSTDQAAAVRVIHFDTGEHYFDPPLWSLYDGVGQDLRHLLQLRCLEHIILRVYRHPSRHPRRKVPVNEAIASLRQYVADLRGKAGNRVKVEIIEQPYPERSPP